MNIFRIKAWSYFCYLLIGLVFILLFPTINESLSPDTRSFLDDSPFRQPFYGLSLRMAFSSGLDWESIKLIQVFIFIFSSIWFMSQLISFNRFGGFCATVFAVHIFIFSQYGLLSIVSLLITEGIYYSLLLLNFGFVLNWIRTRSNLILMLIILVTILTTQLKSAALPLLLSIPFLILILFKVDNTKQRSNRLFIILFTSFLTLLILPALLGKPPMKITTLENRLGFVLVPRISLLKVPEQDQLKYSQWIKSTEKWKKQADNLNLTERTSLDATLQELIRYKLYPTEILPIQKGISIDRSLEGWGSTEYYDDALVLAKNWIMNDFSKYLVISFNHFIGLISYSTLLQTSELKNLKSAYEEINNSSNGLSQLRYDYPVNLNSAGISQITSLIYYYLRGLGLVFLLSITFVTLILVSKIRDLKQLKIENLLFLYIGSFAILQSLPAAFTVFPEIRYVTANMLITISALLSWLCVYLNRFNEE